jgi:uncharacterized protein with von Willebrand factor type A (vWA) domain
MNDERPAGRLAENVMHFARVLREAGMPVGTDRVMLALRALEIAGLESRADFHSVLSACLIDRAEHRDLFDQAFQLFWRDPDLLGRMLAMLLPRVNGPEDRAQLPRENRRLADALFPAKPQKPERDDEQTQLELDASLTFSAREILRKADFDSMTREEWHAAIDIVRRWRTQLPWMRTRRFEAAERGSRLDWRRLAARSARRGGDFDGLCWRRPKLRPTRVVALIDISGSMSQYSRMFLHFLHAMTDSHRETQSFLFGTRLTSITRVLRQRDPDRAVDDCVRLVEDWSGGTRISTCLHEFNLRWSRRVLGQNATVILVTDGLERDDAGRLAFEAERLSKSCHRLLWLNPLLRYDAFEPRAAGIRAILPHVDRHLPVHNLDSLAGLADALLGLSRHARPEHPKPGLQTLSA